MLKNKLEKLIKKDYQKKEDIIIEDNKNQKDNKNINVVQEEQVVK